MIVCKGDTAYKCTELRTEELRNMLLIHFAILEPISRDEIVDMFNADKTFYFYDNVNNCRISTTNDEKIMSLVICYKADLTCNITIKLTKGDDDNES